MASEDYCADVGLRRSPHMRELLYARSKVATYAAAHSLAAFDVVCMDFRYARLCSRSLRSARCTHGMWRWVWVWVWVWVWGGAVYVDQRASPHACTCATATDVSVGWRCV